MLHVSSLNTFLNTVFQTIVSLSWPARGKRPITNENYNKVNNYIPALDRIISEFKSRFAENDSVVLCALANILTNENPDDEAFKEVAKFYTMDEDTLKSEHKMFTHMKETLTDTK